MPIQKINTRHLIIDLFLGAASTQLSIQHLLIGAKVFGITDNGIRVAVTRLMSEGMLQSHDRGIYQLTDQAKHWARLMLNRKQGIKQTKTWNHQYLAVFTGHLGRVDRTALKKRERALFQYGFRELETGIYIRPDNLTDAMLRLFRELKDLGLEPDAKMCVISEFDDITEHILPELWDGNKLNRQYHYYIDKISTWLNQYVALEIEEAAYESFFLGRESISLLMRDPLLPQPFVDETLRNQFAHVVQQLDQTGLKIWQTIYDQHDAKLTLGT